MHPVLATIIAARFPIREEIFRLWQQQLRDQIAPLVAAGEIAQAMAEDQTRPGGRPFKAGPR